MFENIEDYFRFFFQLSKNPNKDKWLAVYNAMAVHTRSEKPIELLLKRRPNEEEHIHKYRIDNYEPITYGSMNKALDDLYRIVNAINFAINAPDNVKQYLKETQFMGYSNDPRNEELTLDLFLQKIVLKRMIEDPNGFLIWLPTGDGLTSSAVKVMPQPKLVYSSQYYYSDDKTFIYLSDERSMLKDGKTQVAEGKVYYIFTKAEYWKMFQVGTKAKPKWVQELIYTHNLGVFPIITLGGDMTSDGYYNSFFSPYLAFGNEAIRQFSDWQAIMTTSSFPHIEEFATECSFEIPDKTSNPIPAGEEKYNKSIELKPLGKSPYGVTLRKIPSNNISEEVLDVNIPSRRFLSPDIGIAKYAGESWEKLVERAEASLNIDLTVGVDQSGVAKQLDKESQYSMITKIGNNFFDNIYTKSIRIIDAYINNKTYSTGSSVLKPSTYWVKNEDDIVNEISTLKEKKVPSFFLAEATMDLAKKRFQGNPVSEKIFSFISLYDPLYIYSVEEKNQLVLSGVVKKEQYVRSVFMFSLLNQIALKKSAEVFVKMEMDAISTEFETLIEPFLPEEVTPIFDPNGQGA